MTNDDSLRLLAIANLLFSEGKVEAEMSRLRELTDADAATNADLQRFREAAYIQSGRVWYPTPKQAETALAVMRLTQ